MAPTDEELLELMPQGFRDDLALVSRMAAHGAGPEVQPGLSRVTLNTGALDYARAVWDRARAALAAEPDGPAVPESREPASVVGKPSDEELLELWQGWNLGWDPQKGMVLMPHPAEYARAVLARYGHQPAPPAEGEVAELVTKLRRLAPHNPLGTADPTITRAADLLERQATACAICERERLHQSTRAADLEVERQAAPVPAEGEVAELVTWLREGGDLGRRQPAAEHQGHRLLGLMELQAGAGVFAAAHLADQLAEAGHLWSERLQALLPIEPTDPTILVLVPVPVALSERPWERDGWCDSKGRCWIHCPGQSWDTWVLTVPQNAIDGAHCLPATALPLPSGEVMTQARYNSKGARLASIRHATAAEILALRDRIFLGGRPDPVGVSPDCLAIWDELTAEADRAEQNDNT